MIPKRPAQSGKRQWARNLVLLAIALLVVRFLMRRGQPERLPDVPWGVLQNGWVYQIKEDERGSIIYAQPITGGAGRLIVREVPENSIAPLSPGKFAITSSAIYYSVMPRPQQFMGTGTGTGSGMGGSASPIGFAGAFRPASRKSPTKQASHEKRAVVHPVPFSYSPERLRRASLPGGTPQDALKIDGTGVTIVGNSVFWIAPKPDESIKIRSGKEWHMKIRGHSDLMVTPLNGGAARKLASGLFTYTQLYAGTDGVYWFEPHVSPDLRIDLYRFRATDTKPLVIKAYGYVSYGSVPVEFQGRLYWFGARSLPSVEDCLMSMNTDGSDRRLLPGPLNQSKMPRTPLVPHRGSLYFVYVDITRGREEYYLYRLHPGPDGKGEIVRRLPNSANDPRLDGDYVYFNVVETHKSLLDWLMDDDAHVVQKSVSYRLRLPD